ncbi:repair protein PSO2 SNM1 [Coemansia sp. Benny D115]|nr:repair protein PSO2 SNM1 [Coemansia sp. Benny D115]
MFLESTVETKPQLNTTDLTCPLCQAWLSQLSSEDAEFHVNSCLDNVILQDKKAQRSAKRLASIKPQPAKTKKKKTTGEFKPTIIRIVHTGDFRASDVHVRRILRVFGTDIAKPVTPDMLLSKDTDLKIELPRIDYIYLDTTYLEPTYAFPKQTQVTEVVSRACYQISRSSTFLPTHLNSIKNAKRASSSGHASSSPDKKKTSLITSWFKPLQKALLAGPNSSGNMDPGSNSNNIRSNVLFVVGTYTIGKERLFIDIARRINSKIYVTKEKRKLLECIASSSVLGMLTDKMAEAQVHAVSMGIVNMSGMAEYLESVQGKSKFTSIVAFSPTGWSHAGPYIPGRKEAPPTIFPELPSAADLATVTKSNDRASVASVLAKSARISSDHQSAFSLDKLRPRGSSNKVTIFPVPYSEHSSFAELARFICSLRATNVIPTVYSSAAKNEYARDWLDHWQRLNELFDSTIKQNAQADGKKESSPLGFALELG